MSRSVFPRDDSAIALCLPKSVKEPPAGPVGFTKSSTTAFASSTCATGIASGCSRATATISRRALRRSPRSSRASTSEELRRRGPRARSATAFGAIWPWRRVAVKLTRHCPEVERRALVGGYYSCCPGNARTESAGLAERRTARRGRWSRTIIRSSSTSSSSTIASSSSRGAGGQSVTRPW